MSDSAVSPGSGITIYHNPKCGTSRNVLALIRDTGVEPEVIEYRRAPTRVYVEEGYVGPPAGGRKRHCREFTQTIKIDGKMHESYGTACLRPDGTWQIEP